MGRPDKRKAARDSHFVGKKKRIPWNKPNAGARSASQKLKLFESDKGSFYNQANWIEEYEYNKGLYYNNYGDYFYEESGKVTATLITKVTVFLIAKVTGTAKIM